MCCGSAYGDREAEAEDYEGGRSGASHCEAQTAVGVPKDESTHIWEEEEIGAYACETCSTTSQ